MGRTHPTPYVGLVHRTLTSSMMGFRSTLHLECVVLRARNSRADLSRVCAPLKFQRTAAKFGMDYVFAGESSREKRGGKEALWRVQNIVVVVLMIGRKHLKCIHQHGETYHKKDDWDGWKDF